MLTRRHLLIATSLATIQLMAKATYAQTPTSSTPPSSRPPEGASPINLKIWQDCQRLTGIRFMSAQSSLQSIFFFDPNCPFCVKLYQSAEQNSQTLSAMLWVPVAYMHQSSLPRAVSLLRSANPQAALKQNFDKFDQPARQGAIAPAEQITPNERTIIQTNSKAWESIMGATPLWLYKTKQGEYWRQAGMPDAERLREIVQALAPAKLQEFKP
jgi:hypothetical protein